MPRVWVSVGTNQDRDNSVRNAIAAMRAEFGELVISPVYETVAVGFEGDPFLNLVVGFHTGQSPAVLHATLRGIEAANGRRRDGEKFGDRSLDLDLLTWGDVVTDEGGRHLPRDEITRYAFVLRPLADVAGDEVHPETGATYAQLWQAMALGQAAGMRLYPFDAGA